MNKFEEGDDAVRKFGLELSAISSSRKTFPDKIKSISDSLIRSGEPWNLKADDRVLSMLRNSACDVIEKLVEKKILEIKNSDETRENKIAKLNLLKTEYANIAFLADGFKSSLNVKISFAVVGLRFKS